VHAEELIAGLRTTMAHLPAAARLKLTWDQGSEMAGHHQIAELFAEGVFFAHAGKPWQRPTHENSNGLLRQYFPKSRVKQLVGAIRTFINDWNERCHPCIWTKTAEEVVHPTPPVNQLQTRDTRCDVQGRWSVG
jgi:IS30 family transposase